MKKERASPLLGSATRVLRKRVAVSCAAQGVWCSEGEETKNSWDRTGLLPPGQCVALRRVLVYVHRPDHLVIADASMWSVSIIAIQPFRCQRFMVRAGEPRTNNKYSRCRLSAAVKQVILEKRERSMVALNFCDRGKKKKRSDETQP